MAKIKFFLLLTFLMGSLSTAQSVYSNITSANKTFDLNQTIPDSIKILAVMVEFVEDNDNNTFGNGKFGTIFSKNYGNTIIDPLPHNIDYFKSHLTFAKNYYDKVSNGKADVDYTVLPNIVTVSKKMRDYSPDPLDKKLDKLGEFAKEVWQLAAAQNTGFDVSEYNVFTIFHAGVGRDVNLPGSVGAERDLPSVYLSPKSLTEIFGAEFTGFDFNGTKITNSIILPETESRELNSVVGVSLIELSINGLLVSNIASFMGLPDLFNTETGLSSIGRFGLMDGQSIFAYQGLFPAEPSAWEKVFLGWETPTIFNTDSTNIKLITKVVAGVGDDKIIKIPVSSTEYFLIENRNRDALKNNAELSIWINGQTITKTFKDTVGFRSYLADSVNGVVVNVDEFDWALPGSGILIWHIDEKIIQKNIVSNTINNDILLRGVDVEEADGVQDIGEKFFTIFGDEVIGEGTDKDLWYSTNNSKLYTNKFSPDSKPNSFTNDGANSLVSITNISAIANEMTFDLSFTGINAELLSTIELASGSDVTSINYSEENAEGFVYLQIGNDVSSYKNDGMLRMSLVDFSNTAFSSFWNNNKEYVIGSVNNQINVYVNSGATDDLTHFPVGSKITTAPVVESVNRVLFGTETGKVYVVDLETLTITDSSNLTTNQPIKFIANKIGNTFIATDQILITPSNTQIQFSASINKIVLTDSPNGKLTAVVLTEGNNISIVVDDKIETEFQIIADDKITNFIIADINNDGNNYIVVNNGSNVEAYNLQGYLSDNFPVNNNNKVNSDYLLAADFNNDLQNDVFSVSKNGSVFAYDSKEKKLVKGFPLSSGKELNCYPLIYKQNNSLLLTTVSKDNYLRTWKISGDAGKVNWSSEFADNLNTSYLSGADNSKQIAEYFPTEKAYNWPNPVYDKETKIRFYVSEDSEVEIKIFDLAGDLVEEINSNATGGMENEITWNVSNIQSGPYLAYLEVSSTSGKKSDKIIKIAVIK